MKTAQHTPGPWEFEIKETGRFEYTPGVIVTPRLTWPGKAYAHPEHDSLRNEAVANARLIAAAPELLDALELMHQHFATNSEKYDSPVAEKARAAIAKARGQA